MPLVRMLLEGQAVTLASLPDSIYEDALKEGMSPSLVAAVKAAHEAFDGVALDDDLTRLQQQIHNDILNGLGDLMKAKP